MITRFVLGFLFTPREEVILIRKTHPEWQAGKLNGVGGHMEGNELPYQAMVREFHEEAGISVANWKLFCCIHDKSDMVYCFVAEGDPPVSSVTDEEVIRMAWSLISTVPVVPSVQWLVPMAKWALASRGRFAQAQKAT